MQLLLSLASTVALLASPLPVSGTAVDPKDKGEPLFPDGHPNITYLTDQNWDFHLNKTDKPWLIDFYHPFCPHCKHFAPAYFELAAYYKAKGDIYVGALSCMDHVKCRRVGITGFPTLMTLNFDKEHPQKENKRIVGTHTVQEVKDYVNNVIAEVAYNQTGTWPPGYTPPVVNVTEEKAPEPAVKEEASIAPTPEPSIWEESTLPMNQTTRIQDAASAFVFGLKQGAFMASEVMDDEELDALKGWLKVVSETFPGATNRKVITPLYEQVKDKELLDFNAWDEIVKNWQEGSIAAFKAEESLYDYTGVEVPEWQQLSDLFVGQGATYRACALYTCGQWNMFHMLTLNPPETGARSGEVMVAVVASIRRFMKHFFGCANCRDHFLHENTVETVKMIEDAEDKPLMLRRWLWQQHNSVNKRLHHPIWPKPDICPTCGTEAAWEMIEVDKWLSSTFGYRDAIAPLAKAPAIAPVDTPESLRKQETEIPLIIGTDNTAVEVAKKNAEPTFKGPITTAPQRSDDKDAKLGNTKALDPMATPALDTPKMDKTATNTAEEYAKSVSKGPIAVEPKGGEEYRPKDAELGIKNAANMKELVADMKTEPKDGLQGAAAPRVTLFAWYVLPLAAVGGYLLFVRSRASKQKAYRQVPRM